MYKKAAIVIWREKATTPLKKKRKNKQKKQTNCNCGATSNCVPYSQNVKFVPPTPYQKYANCYVLIKRPSLLKRINDIVLKFVSFIRRMIGKKYDLC